MSETTVTNRADTLAKDDPFRSLSIKEMTASQIVAGTALKAVFDEATQDDGKKDFSKVTSLPGIINDSYAVLEKVREMNDTLTQRGKFLDEQKSLITTQADVEKRLVQYETPVNGAPVATTTKRKTTPKTMLEVAEIFRQHPNYIKAKESGGAKFQEAQFSVTIDDALIYNPYEAKATITTGAGFAQEARRTGQVVDFALLTPTIMDLVPVLPTNLDTVRWMEETTHTANIAPTAEAAALPEGAHVWTEQTAIVEWIGEIQPVTEQQLDNEEDVDQLLGRILPMKWARKAEQQILTGTGASPEIRGYYNQVGIQTFARAGGVNIPDTIYEVFTLIRTLGFAEPDLVIIHPDNWKDVRLLKDLNGNYIWGNPAESGPERIWGKMAHQTTAATLNSAIMGEFQLYSSVRLRRGATVSVGLVNDDFQRGQVTMRVDGRLTLQMLRASAFGTATALEVIA